MQNRIPDFSFIPWRLIQILDLTAQTFNNKSGYEYSKIGKQDIYINESTGETGINITTLKNGCVICKTWEKRLMCGGKLTTLYYAAVWSLGEWKTYRLKYPAISAEIRKGNSEENLGVDMTFTLITEKEIGFFLPMELINAL